MHDNVKLTICNKSRGTSIHHKFAITVFYCNIIKWKACAFSTMEPKFSQCGNFILLQPENHILYDNSEIIQYNSLETIWYTITWKRMTLQPGIYLIFWKPMNLQHWTMWVSNLKTYKKCYTKERSYDCYNQKLFESTTETNSLNLQTNWYFNHLVTFWHNILKTNDITNWKPYDMKT